MKEEPVEIKSLAELCMADERTLRFAPLGLALGGTMRPGDAAVFQQEVISHAELAPGVAESTRKTFERLRSLHAYGVLFYDIFTVVEDQARLVIEQALRDRFLEFHGDTVAFEDARGTVHPVSAATFDAVFSEIHKESRLRKQRWRLRVRRTGELIYFNGMLDSLIRWARGEGLLRGQRNRLLEPVLKRFRDRVAHGSGYHLDTPVQAARTINDTAEIINHLWGAPTPGGRLYPAPIRREIQVVAWGPDGAVMSGLVSAFPAEQEHAGETHVLVRAVLHDEGLMHFDALYETTTYPCEFLWGPGAWQDAAAWLKKEQPAEDEVDSLDRLFLLQYHEHHLHLPRSPGVATGLGEDQRHGRWYLVRADFPLDAFGHVRHLVTETSSSFGAGPCEQCAAETVGAGNWQEMIDLAAASGNTVTPRWPPDTAVTSAMGWPRHVEIPETGS